MNIMEQEYTLTKICQDLTSLPAIKASACSGSFKAAQNSFFVLIGLQATNEPGACVGKSLVVKIHRILSGEHHTQSKGSGLLQQGQQR
jgi:hypothetical protein